MSEEKKKLETAINKIGRRDPSILQKGCFYRKKLPSDKYQTHRRPETYERLYFAINLKTLVYWNGKYFKKLFVSDPRDYLEISLPLKDALEDWNVSPRLFDRRIAEKYFRMTDIKDKFGKASNPDREGDLRICRLLIDLGFNF